MNKNAWLRKLPKVDELLEDQTLDGVMKSAPRAMVVEAVRSSIDEWRQIILVGRIPGGEPEALKEQVAVRALEILKQKAAYRLKPVVNATGVVLHTNLGRALLSEEAVERILRVSGSYSTLEYNLETGSRGLRYSHVEDLICQITGAEAAFVVNNNAAAVLLALNTLSEGKEAVVSRGQLVEIGGSFRVPDVMRQSGAILREVGTTNKTHLRDYKENINEETGLLLKVHTSNYRILGFSEEVPLKALWELGREHGIPVMEDIGSGTLIDFSKHGMAGEPTVQEAVRYADVVTFSGDKMLGGPQAGVIVGKKEHLDRMKKNPFTRAFRVDKMTLAGLEATFRHYIDPGEALRKIPTLRMLTASEEDLRMRAERLAEVLRSAAPRFSFETMEGHSQVGGGSMPLEKLPTTLVAARCEGLSAARVESGLRGFETPVIARISEDRVLLDIRTIRDDQFGSVVDAFASLDGRGDEA